MDSSKFGAVLFYFLTKFFFNNFFGYFLSIFFFFLPCIVDEMVFKR